MAGRKRIAVAVLALLLFLPSFVLGSREDIARIRGDTFRLPIDCAAAPDSPGSAEVRIPAPPEGWPEWAQAIVVLDTPPGLVRLRRGEEVRCGLAHDARSTDSRFRAGVGAVFSAAPGSRAPIIVTAPRLDTGSHGLTIRYGDPAPVQREDTLRFAVRMGGLAVVFAMLLSALLVFAGARDRIAGMFVLAGSAMGLWLAVRSGFAAWPRPWLPGEEAMYLALQLLPVPGFGGLWYVALAYGRADRVLPRLYRTRHLVFLLAALVAGQWWLGGPEPTVFWRGFAFLLLLAMLAVGIACWRAGQPGGRAVVFALAPQLLVLGPLYGTLLRAWHAETLILGLAWYTVVMTLALSLRMGALARQRDRMKALAERDPLTGLPNRRAMAPVLPRRIDEAQALGKPLALVFVDLDRFKQVNDTHGHAVGDAVLVEVGRRLASQLRGGDMVARHGGEEFVMLVPGADAAEAAAVAERLRRLLAETPVETAAGALPVTASFGYAVLRPDDPGGSAGVAALIARADAAMYRAKQNGRNRVEGDAG